MRDEMIEFDCEYVHETDAAYLVEIDGEEVWLPKSQVEYDGGDSVNIPRWLAEAKELEW